MFNIFSGKKNELTIVAPVNGKVIDITEVPDVVFASKMMGDGFAVDAIGDVITAPCDGVIALISDTKHAIVVQCEGVEVLIHIGIDTVELEGKGFDVKVKAGDKVKLGDCLVVLDREYILEKGKSLIVPVVVINMAEKVQQLIKNIHDTEKILTIEIK